MHRLIDLLLDVACILIAIIVNAFVFGMVTEMLHWPLTGVFFGIFGCAFLILVLVMVVVAVTALILEIGSRL